MISSLLHFLFPSTCLNCKRITFPDNKDLCPHCLSHFVLINPQERCKVCFSEKEDPTSYCQTCLTKPPFLCGIGSCFDIDHPAFSLLKALKYERRIDLAKTIAAFCIIQIDRLNWPVPDILIFLPVDSMWKDEKEIDLTKEIASELGKFWKRPVKKWIKKKERFFLKREKNPSLAEWKLICHEEEVRGKSLLLVDEIYEKKEKFSFFSKLFWSFSPRDVYGFAPFMEPSHCLSDVLKH